MLSILLFACQAPPSGQGSATQIGAEGHQCTGCMDGVAATPVFPSPERAALDTRAVLVTGRETEELEIELLAERSVSASLESWPLLGGGYAIQLVPDARLAALQDYELRASDQLGSLQTLSWTFQTGTELAGPVGVVQIEDFQPWQTGVAVTLSATLDEPSWVRVHAGSCAEPTRDLLAVDGIGYEGPEITLRTYQDVSCVCAVLVSASGEESEPTELVCL